MAWPWEHGFGSSYMTSYSSSHTYDSDDDDYFSSHDIAPQKAVKKPKPLKAVKNERTGQVQKKKSAHIGDDHLEKIEIFACKVCNKRYNSKASYKRHYTTAHAVASDVKEVKKQKTGNTASKALATWSASPRFRCHQCGKELTSQVRLDNHMATHERSLQPKPKTAKARTTNVKVNVYNTVNYHGYSAPNNFMSIGNGFFRD